MSKTIFLITFAMIASTFSTMILMNQPQAIGVIIAFLLITFVALILYILFIDVMKSKLTNKALLQNNRMKNNH